MEIKPIFADSKKKTMKREMDLMLYKDTGWININDVIKYRKVNNIVTVVIYNVVLKGLGVSGQWENVFILPLEFHPTNSIAFAIGYNDNYPRLGNAIVQPNGIIKCISDVGGAFLGSVSYPV